MKKKYVAGIFLLLLLASCYMIWFRPNHESNSVILTSKTDESKHEYETMNHQETMKECEVKVPVICVYVCGSVNQPGLYELKDKSRIADAVNAAGGFTKDACTEAVNLAEYIYDAQKVYVPNRDHVSLLEVQQESQNMQKVNINTATLSQLMTLPGIGQAKAESILLYRTEHGNFERIEDIMNIPGIKDAVFQKLKDKIMI